MFEKAKWCVIRDDFPLFVESFNLQTMANLPSGEHVKVRGLDLSNVTIFHLTILYRKPSFVEFCLSEGYDVNKTLADDWTPLLLAIYLEYSEIVQILVFYGANINAANKYGTTPLLLAIQLKNEEILKILLKSRQKIQDLVNPLHACIVTNQINLAKLLLQAGANPNEKCSIGKTAFESLKPDQKEMKDLLENKQEPQQSPEALFAQFSPDKMTLNELLELVDIQPDPPETPFYQPLHL